MNIKYWCFNRIDVEQAITEFCDEIAAGEGRGSPDASHADARLIRDFLNSEVALRRGLLKRPGDDRA